MIIRRRSMFPKVWPDSYGHPHHNGKLTRQQARVLIAILIRHMRMKKSLGAKDCTGEWLILKRLRTVI